MKSDPLDAAFIACMRVGALRSRNMRFPRRRASVPEGDATWEFRVQVPKGHVYEFAMAKQFDSGGKVSAGRQLHPSTLSVRNLLHTLETLRHRDSPSLEDM